MEFVIKKSSWYFISKTQIDVFSYQELKKNRINSKTARWSAVLLFILYFVISKIDFWYLKKIHFLIWKKIDDLKKSIQFLDIKNRFFYIKNGFLSIQKWSSDIKKWDRFLDIKSIFYIKKYRINSKAPPHTFSRLFSSARHPPPPPLHLQ